MIYGVNVQFHEVHVRTRSLGIMGAAHAIALLVWPISFVLSSGLKGAGDTRYTMTIAIISMWIFRIFTGYLIGIVLNFGVFGIWIAMYMDWLVRGILYCFRLRGEQWIKHKIV